MGNEKRLVVELGTVGVVADVDEGVVLGTLKPGEIYCNNLHRIRHTYVSLFIVCVSAILPPPLFMILPR